MLAIFKKELRSYLYSPIPYALTGLLVAFLSYIFSQSYFNGTQTTLDMNVVNSILGTAQFVLMFLIPILTMKIFAEERKNKTDALLMSAPVNITSIVIGKFLATFTIYIIIAVFTFMYPIIIIVYSKVYSAEMIGSYVGFLLIGGCLIAFGMFASSLTESQILSAIISILGFLLMIIINLIGNIFTKIGVVGEFINNYVITWLSPFERNQLLNQGLFTITPIIYYLSFIALFGFLTIKVIEKRRWS